MSKKESNPVPPWAKKPPPPPAPPVSLCLGYLDDEVKKIIFLVQENQDFFGVEWGDSCLKQARIKLEQMIKDKK